MAYADIPNTDVDAKSGFKTGVLMGQLRDNIDALYEHMRHHEHKTDSLPSVKNSTVLVNDSTLAFPIAANELWLFVLDLFISTNTTADFKFQITAPAGATGYSMGYLYTPATRQIDFFEGAHGAAIDVFPAANLAGHPARVFGFVVNGGNAGTVQLQYAQRVADPGTTAIVSSSSLLAWMGSDLAAAVPGSYTAVTDADIDPDSQLIQQLMERLRDNPIYLSHATRVLKRKTAPETVTASTVLQDDDDLLFPVGANERWHFLFVLRVSTNATADFKFTFVTPSVPAGTDYYFYMHYDYVDWYAAGPYEAFTFNNYSVAAPGAIATFTIQYDAAIGSTWTFWIEGWVDVGASGGNFKLQWAQGTSDPVNTQVLANSFCWAQRMDHV